MRQTPKHDYFRGILIFCREQTAVEAKEIIIKNEMGDYKEKFIVLLKDYYLHL